jgi:acyl phosphate:glycerol-3-phosphate acyltransferase
MNYIISIIIGYCFGMINPAYIIAKKVKGIDIRNSGSKNSGATNVTIVIGWKYGILTAFIDISKGILAILLCKYLLSYNENLLFLVAFGVIIGHDFPFYLKFKGGKGTAPFIGLMIAINPALGIVGIITLIIVTVITDYIAIGTIIMNLEACILVYFYYPIYCFVILVILFILVVFKHINNIIKISRSEEIGLRKILRKKNKKSE